MRGNFIPDTTTSGGGRCRICDLSYSKSIKAEVVDHQRYHRLYLEACDTVGAPAPERVRRRLLDEGLELMRGGATLKERVSGGEKWLDSRYNDYAFRMLYAGECSQPRSEFFMRLDARGDISANMDSDVAAALREKYSDAPMD